MSYEEFKRKMENLNRYEAPICVECDDKYAAYFPASETRITANSRSSSITVIWGDRHVAMARI